MSTARLSRWARRFLVVSAGFLVLSQAASLVSAPRGVVVVLGLYGFVLTTVFGKAYSLVPSYFDRQLAWQRAPQIQLPLLMVGVLALALARWGIGPELLETGGVIAWVGGVAVFLGTIGWTVRDNVTGAATGTGDASAEREPLDRLANAFVPVALAYLLVGMYELTATVTPLPALLDGVGIRIAHLLGPGFAVLTLFAVGYRLLPRFLAVVPSRRLAAVVLPAGAVGPALIAVGYPSGVLFRAGAALEAVAVVGFTASFLSLYVRSERSRVGFHGPLLGTLFGCLGVGLGLYFAFAGVTADLTPVHVQVNVFGLLGLTIVGVVYQFYPPAVAQWRGTGDRLALVSIAGLAVGLLGVVCSPLTAPPLARAGHALTTGSAAAYWYVLAAVVRIQTQR
jgi:hypothetical protein